MLIGNKVVVINSVNFFKKINPEQLKLDKLGDNPKPQALNLMNLKIILKLDELEDNP